jgi:hypothetical protein
MAKKLFIDSDVILDLLAEKSLFYDDAAKIFSLIIVFSCHCAGRKEHKAETECETRGVPDTKLIIFSPENCR